MIADDLRRLHEMARGEREITDGDLGLAARALREIPDADRLALFRKLLAGHGARPLAEVLAQILEADGFPAPAKGAARIVTHLVRGMELSRTTRTEAEMVDMNRARGVAVQLTAMPPDRRRAAIQRRLDEVGPERFRREAAILTAAVRGPAGADLSRGPGAVGTLRDVAAVVPRRRVAPARPDDPAYLAVKRQSGRA